MRTYYLHASRISRLTSLIIHRSVESARSLFSGKYTFGRNLRDGIRIFKGQISVTKPDILKTNPGNLICIFDDMQKYACQMAQERGDLWRRALYLIDHQFRRSAAANMQFFQI